MPCTHSLVSRGYEGGPVRATTPPSSKGRRQVELAWKDFQSMRARLNKVFWTKTGVAALAQASHPQILRQVRASRRRATVDCVLADSFRAVGWKFEGQFEGQFEGGRRSVCDSSHSFFCEARCDWRVVANVGNPSDVLRLVRDRIECSSYLTGVQGSESVRMGDVDW